MEGIENLEGSSRMISEPWGKMKCLKKWNASIKKKSAWKAEVGEIVGKVWQIWRYKQMQEMSLEMTLMMILIAVITNNS